MTSCLAYLDPGSGSMVLQVLLGGVAAVAVAAKLYWRRLTRFLRLRKDDIDGANLERGSEADSG